MRPSKKFPSSDTSSEAEADSENLFKKFMDTPSSTSSLGSYSSKNMDFNRGRSGSNIRSPLSSRLNDAFHIDTDVEMTDATSERPTLESSVSDISGIGAKSVTGKRFFKNCPPLHTQDQHMTQSSRSRAKSRESGIGKSKSTRMRGHWSRRCRPFRRRPGHSENQRGRDYKENFGSSSSVSKKQKKSELNIKGNQHQPPVPYEKIFQESGSINEKPVKNELEKSTALSKKDPYDIFSFSESESESETPEKIEKPATPMDTDQSLQEYQKENNLYILSRRTKEIVQLREEMLASPYSPAPSEPIPDYSLSPELNLEKLDQNNNYSEDDDDQLKKALEASIPDAKDSIISKLSADILERDDQIQLLRTQLASFEESLNEKQKRLAFLEAAQVQRKIVVDSYEVKGSDRIRGPQNLLADLNKKHEKLRLEYTHYYKLYSQVKIHLMEGEKQLELLISANQKHEHNSEKQKERIKNLNEELEEVKELLAEFQGKKDDMDYCNNYYTPRFGVGGPSSCPPTQMPLPPPRNSSIGIEKKGIGLKRKLLPNLFLLDAAETSGSSSNKVAKIEKTEDSVGDK